jgi:hypothetical protein
MQVAVKYLLPRDFTIREEQVHTFTPKSARTQSRRESPGKSHHH